MSDTHVWRPTRAASDAAMAELADYHEVLQRRLAKVTVEHGQADPAAQALLKVWNELDEVAGRMRAHLVEPVRVEAEPGRHARRMGEDTQAWVVSGGQVPMRRNRGPR